MTLIYQVNNLYSNGTQTMFGWKEFMKLTAPFGPGWSIKSSSNGTTFGVGDNIASAITFGNSGWFVLDDPAHNREILVQRGTTDLVWWISYSKSAGFTGGNATTRPTASDEAIILSNAGGTAVTTWTQTVEAVYHFMANDTDGYGFYMAGFTRGNDVTSIGGFVMDEIESSSINIDGYNNDAVIFYVAINSNNDWNTVSLSRESVVLTTDRVVSWLYYGHASQSFTNTPALYYCTGAVGGTAGIAVPGLTIIDKSVTTTQRHLVFPVFYARRSGLSGTTGWKGMGKHLKIGKSVV